MKTEDFEQFIVPNDDNPHERISDQQSASGEAIAILVVLCLALGVGMVAGVKLF